MDNGLSQTTRLWVLSYLPFSYLKVNWRREQSGRSQVPGSDPGADLGSDPSSDPGLDPSSDPGFTLTLSRNFHIWGSDDNATSQQ